MPNMTSAAARGISPISVRHVLNSAPHASSGDAEISGKYLTSA